jgi:hypothetical protein
MSRYAKYFLKHLLCVEDTFSRYYVQDDSWASQEILDVEYIIFDWEEEAEDWLAQCIEFDRSTTLDSLRHMLAYECLTTYQVHRMNDNRVVRTVAGELCTNAWRIVIEPKIGWAVRMDQKTEVPVQPVAVDATSDVDGLLDELRVALDGLVAEQKKNFDEWEAKLAKMSDAEKALAYGKSTGEGAYNGIIGGIIDMETSWLSFMWKAIKYPLRFAEIEREALRTGSFDPIRKEIKSKIDPVLCSAKEIKHYTAMAMVLLGEAETRDMLIDFAQRFWDNTHPIEKTKLVADLGSDTILTVLLAIFTAGLGAAANVAAKSNRLVKVAKLLEKVAKTMKRVKSFTRLPKKRKGPGLGKKKPRARAKLKGKGPQKPKTPKKRPDLDGNKKKSYPDSDGPKKTSEPDKGPTKTPEKYKNKAPTKEDISLAEKPGKLPKQIAARKKLAAHFYEKQGMKDSKISGHLQGIDFDKPVQVEQLAKGQRLAQ